MNAIERERQIIDLIAPRLKAEGYSVYTHPTRHLLPAFMQDYVPDAIALGTPKNIAIEIVRAGPASTATAQRLSERFEGVTDWELRIVYASPEPEEPDLTGASKDAINAAVRKVETLANAGQTEAALLLGWAVLEAVGRFLAPDHLAQPQAPAQLMEQLAMEGVVTPEEVERLRNIAALRNRVAHGALELSVRPEVIEDLVQTLRAALAENAADPIRN